MASSIDLVTTKNKLLEGLGDNFKIYLHHMKSWFQQKLTKEEFDVEARKLLKPDTIKFHNEFMLAILIKCQSLSPCRVSTANKESGNNEIPSQIKGKLQKSCLKKRSRYVRSSSEHRMKPENPLNHAPQLKSRDPAEDTKVSFCSREMLLPDISMIYCRMFVTAWDCGLDSVDDDAVRLTMVSVEMMLKSLLTEIFSRRKSFKLREGRFRYGFGTGVPNPYQMSSRKILDLTNAGKCTELLSTGEHVPISSLSYELGEGLAAHEIAFGKANYSPFQPVSLSDLFETLKVKPGLLSSHSVYTINMERIVAKLNHPSHEDIDQDNIHQQEKRLREQLKSKYLYA